MGFPLANIIELNCSTTPGIPGVVAIAIRARESTFKSNASTILRNIK